MPRTRSSSSRSSFLPAELRGPLLAGLGVFVASWLFVSYLPKFGVWLYGDVRFYENWGAFMANHEVPYRDFRHRVPAGRAAGVSRAGLSAASSSATTGRTTTGSASSFSSCGLLIAGRDGLCARTARRIAAPGVRRALLCRRSGRRSLGPIALARFDYWPALIAVAAVAALAARRPMLACGLAAGGAAVKVYPGRAHPARAHRAVAAGGSAGGCEGPRRWRSW